MRRSIDIDTELAGQLKQIVNLTREKPAVVMRQALRAGLPIVANRLAAPRPEGYFADAYQKRNRERSRLELAMAKVKQRPER